MPCPQHALMNGRVACAQADPLDMTREEFDAEGESLLRMADVVQKQLTEMCHERKEDFVTGLERVREMQTQVR
jgi:hypothetical protein